MPENFTWGPVGGGLARTLAEAQRRGGRRVIVRIRNLKP